MLRFFAIAGAVLAGSSALAEEIPLSAKENAVRKVVRAVAEKAIELQKLPQKERPVGDALTDAYIRAAAVAANRIDKAVRVSSFLIGLGIALDDSTILSRNPLTKKLCAAAENAEDRKERIKNLGSPTIHKRRDLCQHFAVSVALTEIVGPQLAELAGLSKELSDMKGTSGFSFIDLCLDLAGIEFATRIQKSPTVLDKLAKEFTVSDYAPDIAGLREDLNEATFKKDFGGVGEQRYKEQVEDLRKRVGEVKGYR